MWKGGGGGGFEVVVGEGVGKWFIAMWDMFMFRLNMGLCISVYVSFISNSCALRECM
jgi:hypothetical protein